MNTKKEELGEIMDSLEKVLTSTIKSLLGQSGIVLTDDDARNLLGKIGARIMFDKGLVDDLLMSPSK